MRRIEISLTKYRICSCNVCLARNYEPEDKRCVVGEYTPDIFDVCVGSLCIHLCRDCLETLGDAATDVAARLSDRFEGPEG